MGKISPQQRCRWGESLVATPSPTGMALPLLGLAPRSAGIINGFLVSLEFCWN